MGWRTRVPSPAIATILKARDAIPRILALFRQYGVRATWATVGMLMCRDHAQWRELRPSVLPGYVRKQRSSYSLGKLAYEYPRLFFARPLVEQILATPGQELATHTYSHFYCGEEGATPEQFSADLACAQIIASDMGANCRSLVFPRNQVREEFVAVLPKAGIEVYRRNPDHWLYRNGHYVPGGMAGRMVRLADAWLPLTGTHVARVTIANGLVSVPASLFAPMAAPAGWAGVPAHSPIEAGHDRGRALRGICHLWWHPHNFGVNTEQNLAVLESLLQHFVVLQDRHGMRSVQMGGRPLI